MNLGMPEMVFLVFLGLLLFGPKKLPEIGRQLGRIMAEFKRASEEFQSQLRAEVDRLELNETTEEIETLLHPINSTSAEVTKRLTTALNDSPTKTASNG